MGVHFVMWSLWLKLGCCCWALVGYALTQVPVDLGKFQWIVTNANGSLRFPAAGIPGCVHTDLWAAGIIGDPYLRTGDTALRWICKENWRYSTVFDAPDPGGRQGAAVVFYGLDGPANVYLNDGLIGRSNSMHHAFVYPLNISRLRRTNNRLEVAFGSPVIEADRKATAYEHFFGYDVPPNCPSGVQHGECHVNFVRKMAASFSWDWAPAFPTVGIWRPVMLFIFRSFLLHQFSIVPVFHAPRHIWRLHIEFKVYCVSSNVISAAVTDRNGSVWRWEVAVSPGWNTLTNKIAIAEWSVDRWWPLGYGQPVLYPFKGTLSCDDEVQERLLKVGFRTVELLQPDVQPVGMQFYFAINGVPIFLKGANWVPSDSFLPRVSNDKVSLLLDSCVKANMNTIRLWGGGIYESDFFYEEADRRGILIWQDFMFACALYPVDPEFLASVYEEVDYQLMRLKHHPSIFVWAANNENEIGVVRWYRGKAPRTRYVHDYLTLYKGIVEDRVRKFDFKSRPFLMSSPTNGKKSAEEGGISEDANSVLYGDVHFYAPLKDQWKVTTYPVARCVSEFGFQSLPFVETLESAGFGPADMTYFGRQLMHRQHHPLYQGAMRWQALRHFPRPRVEGLEAWVLLTQLYQAVVYKTALEHWRRWRGRFDNLGRGGTMCALYWQLNDVWQAPSWSTIDFSLKWKLSHYYVMNAFLPLLVSVQCETDDACDVYAVSDLLEPIEQAVLLVQLYSWGAQGPGCSMQTNISVIKPQSSQLIYTLRNALSCSLRDYDIMTVELVNRCGNWHLLKGNLKDVAAERLGHVRLVNVSRGDSERQFVVQLEADVATAFVWLDVRHVTGSFEDNGFPLLAKRRSVKFDAYADVDLQTFTDSLTVRSLADVYV